MLLNSDIEVIDVGDPFTQEELGQEPPTNGPRLIDSNFGFGPIARWAISKVPDEIRATFRDRLALRLDKFELGQNPKPQPLHYDKMKNRWDPNALQLIIVLGSGTGMTDVCEPFEHAEPETWQDAVALADKINSGKLHIRRLSFPTGRLILSKRPFIHGRGACSSGIRLAYDFGLYDPNEEQAWTFEGE